MSRYKFEGRVVRLNERDYDQWRKIYHAIPDFDAALFTADLQLAGEDGTERPRNWFSVVSSKLQYQHQKYFGQEHAANSQNREPTNTETAVGGLASALAKRRENRDKPGAVVVGLSPQKTEQG